ncbi:MAG: twin-arginine translocase subunit TatB [Gammaproteobacteria bacterium]|nr:twin-arginine translocase subunit TatB [Gammaproteobacteria bacterium]
MFDFGFWELILVMVVALLVVGPERLPGLAKQAGLWVGKAKRFINSVRSDIEREIRADDLKKMLNQQQDEIQELKGMIAETHSQVKTELNQSEDLVKESVEHQLQSKSTSTPPNHQPRQEPFSVTSDNDAEQSKGSRNK